MPTDVVMPQMGESITEGTLTKWLKKVGDTVQRDEPLFEISTDKVDAEIPSPAAGTLAEIKTPEGATVQINTVVAVISDGNSEGRPAPGPGAPVAGATPAPAAPEPAPAAAPSASGPGTEVPMPQMGESITEGTITKWLKQVGEAVERDEPLFEISTDKVDAEIPSPAAGTLTEIKYPEGSTVQINTIVAVIGGGGAPGKVPAAAGASAAAPAPAAAAPVEAASSGEKLRSSPLVRKIAKDNNVDLARVPGTGSAGRITKSDILSHLENPAPAAPAAKPAAAAVPPPAAAAKPAAPAPAPGELVPMSKMRSIIAKRMVESKQTSPHVHTVFKVDMTRIVRLREKEKSKYEQRNGVKLTYMPFITRAAIMALRKHPIVNGSIEGDAIRYNKNINIGIAVALDWGLIVPVIKNTEEKNFLGIARAIVDVAERARQEARRRRDLRRDIYPDQLGHLRRAVRHAHHQPAAVGHPRHRRAEQGGRSADRQGRQRLHRHPLDPALHPGLRPPHRRRRRRRQIHVRLQSLPGNLERRHRVRP